jgi:hypothetical protein
LANPSSEVSGHHFDGGERFAPIGTLQGSGLLRPQSGTLQSIVFIELMSR